MRYKYAIRFFSIFDVTTIKSNKSDLMRTPSHRSFLLIIVPLLLVGLLSFQRSAQQRVRVLVFSKTDGFRHESINAGKTALKKMADQKGFDIDFTEDANQFVTNNLKNITQSCGSIQQGMSLIMSSKV